MSWTRLIRITLVTTHESLWTILTAEASDLLLRCLLCLQTFETSNTTHRRNPEREMILLAMRKDPMVHSVTDLRRTLRLSSHLVHFDMSLLLLVIKQIRKAEDGKLDVD